jgi:hypothetical protein
MPNRKFEITDQELDALLAGETIPSLEEKMQASPEFEALVRQVMKIEAVVKHALTPPSPEQITDYVSGALSADESKFIEFFMAIDDDIRHEVEISMQFISAGNQLADESFGSVAPPKPYMNALIQPFNSYASPTAALRSTSLDRNFVVTSPEAEIAITIYSSLMHIEIAGSLLSETEAEYVDGIVELWSAETFIEAARIRDNSFHFKITLVDQLEARFIMGRADRIKLVLISDDE